MARNILKTGHSVIGYKRDASQMRLPVANGAEIADSANDASRGADFVISMLPFGSIVKSALFDEGGIVETLSKEPLNKSAWNFR